MLNVKKSNRNRILLMNVVAYLIAIISIVADRVYSLENEALSSFVSIMYPTVITVAGFLITIYILFLEIYKDRYPLEHMQKKHFPNTQYYLYAIVYNVIVGCLVLCIGKGLISFVLFCATSLITIISILIFVSKSNKLLMLTTYVEEFCNDIKEDFKINKSSVSSLTVKNIKSVLDECVTREEYHIVGVVVEETGEVFRGFLENSIAIANKKDNSSQTVLEAFNQIVDLNIFELELCKTIKSSQLVNKIIVQQCKNLCFCIENYQIEWYRKYFEKYLKYLYKIQNDNFTEIAKIIYGTFPIVLQCLYKNDKFDCAEETIKEIDNLNTSVVRINKKANSKIYIRFLGGAVDYAIKKENDKLLDLLIGVVSEYLYALIKHSDSFGEIVEYYKWIFDSVLNYSTEKAIVLYERCVDAFSYNSMQTSDLIECNMFCLSRLLDEDRKEKKNQEKFIEYHVDLLYQVSKAKEKYVGYLFFPEFESMILENQGSVDEIRKSTNYMRKILNQCILGDNIPLFYEFIQKINDILKKTKSQQKFVQEELLSLYFWLIHRTHQLVNKQFLEIAFFNFDTAIEILDNNKAISEDLGEYIINNLHDLCKRNMLSNAVSSLDIIDMLSHLLLRDDPYYFVVTRNKTRKMLYKTLFNIGTDCVENGFEDGVRSVSNALGWLIIDSIKRGNDDLTSYAIARVSELYSIATTMQISHKTRMFMLTLFPTVGAYCCKSRGYSKYCNRIIEAIKSECTKNVETAVRLRTSENDMWNGLYEGQTDELTCQFMDKYRKAVSGSNGKHNK